MISDRLCAQLVSELSGADWRTKYAVMSAATRAADDAEFHTLISTVSALKVGPKGYVHGWIKVGAGGVKRGDLGIKFSNDDRSFTVDHLESGTTLAHGKSVDIGKYKVTHADGTKLGKFTSLPDLVEAVARHHTDKYSVFDRDKEPELAGYHDAMSGKPAADMGGRTEAYRKAYRKGQWRASTEDEDTYDALERLPASKAASLNKVGPKGYIHGWIKVGDAADSLDLHTDKSTGKLTPKRAALHDKIVEGTLAGHEPKEKPVATFLGGGPASGKSTVMSDTEGKLVVDADGMKAKLPEYKRMVKNGDKRAASFAHEESSHLANRTMQEAAKRKLDFTLDGTGDSGIEKLTKKVEAARKNGHSIDAKYVTVDTDEAVRRAMKRAARTGRMVPESTIRATHAAVSRTFEQAIKNNLFDTAELWDNNGKEPKLIGRKLAGGPFQVHDRAAWEKFLAKGQEA